MRSAAIANRASVHSISSSRNALFGTSLKMTVSVRSPKARKSDMCRAEFSRGLFMADTALVDCDVAEARAGALKLLDEALARPDVYVSIVSTESTGMDDFMANAEVGAVLGAKRLRQIAEKGSMCRGVTGHAKAIMQAYEAGVNAGDIVLIEGSSEGLARVSALESNIRVLLTPSLCSVEDMDRQEAIYCRMGAEAVCASLETDMYRVTLDDLLPKEGETTQLEQLVSNQANECIVDWVAMSNESPRPFFGA